MSLAERLVRQIAIAGPMSVAAYMTACLHDPAEGYYATRPRLGADGDFITAPLVSQMFGELIGLWAVDIWRRIGAPRRVRVIELGPGGGALMSDALRAARAAPGFLDAAEIWLLEASAPLRALQACALQGRGSRVRWISQLDDLPPSETPIVLIANEFLDCLPIHQWVRTRAGWAERRIGLTSEGEIAFVLAAPNRGSGPARGALDASEGSVAENSPELARLGARIGELLVAVGGAALFIDYAKEGGDFGDTLQAVRGHARESPLAHPGEADVTCHADFDAFTAAARSAGATTTAIRTQGDFLRALGVEARAARLTAAHPDRAEVIARQLDRLIAQDQMGGLFKVVCVHAPGVSASGF
ncbi:MAG: class I SAM-dependent methyltransferase [Caulobacteraceae bacterium]